jgi:putative CocE/NonD family hydrolase
MSTDKPTEAGTDSYVSDPAARRADNLADGQDSWWRLPVYEWDQPVAGKALSYVSSPLGEDQVMVGTGSADLWLKSSEADTDLQVTLTEVRPDGLETYVQSGWLRASKRKLDEERSSALQPSLTQAKGDAEDLPAGRFTKVRVEIHPFGHVFRKGSRLRLIISAPGADKPVWSFVTLDGTQKNSIVHSPRRSSAVVLPVVPDGEGSGAGAVPAAYPPCPGLRGQPCRAYQPLPN